MRRRSVVDSRASEFPGASPWRAFDLPSLRLEPIDGVAQRRAEEASGSLRDNWPPPRGMKDNFDTTRRSVLLEPDDRVDGTGKSLPETGDLTNIRTYWKFWRKLISSFTHMEMRSPL